MSAGGSNTAHLLVDQGAMLTAGFLLARAPVTGQAVSPTVCPCPARDGGTCESVAVRVPQAGLIGRGHRAAGAVRIGRAGVGRRAESDAPAGDAPGAARASRGCAAAGRA